MNFTYELLYTVAIFSACSLINVILNTFKTIIMYKKNIISSANINAITYGFYTVIVVLMAGTMPLWIKIVATAVTNWIGVCISMKILKKFEKDKLWLVKSTISKKYADCVKELLNDTNVPFSYIDIDKYMIFDCYCATQEDTTKVAEIFKAHDGKLFASENIYR